MKKGVSVQKLNRLLPLVAIGTIADAQSIQEPVNRLLVKAGLKILQSNQYNILGLQELMSQTGMDTKIQSGYQIGSQDLAFLLSPILNSSGRINHASLSIRTLIEKDSQKAKKFADELIQTNNQRKQEVRNILEQVEIQATDQILKNQNYIWLEGPWHKGIIGLLASRLVAKEDLPVVVVGLSEDKKATASLRAPDGYHLPEAMKKADKFLDKYGGHPGAAGFTCKQDKLLKVREIMAREFVSQAARQELSGKKFIPVELESKALELGVNSKLFYQRNLIWLQDSEINMPEFSQIFQLEPFGQDFEYPEFMIFVNNPYTFRLIGKDRNHIRLTTRSGLSITKFNPDSDLLERIKAGKNCLVQVRLSQNSWQGSTVWQLAG